MGGHPDTGDPDAASRYDAVDSIGTQHNEDQVIGPLGQMRHAIAPWLGAFSQQQRLLPKLAIGADLGVMVGGR